MIALIYTAEWVEWSLELIVNTATGIGTVQNTLEYKMHVIYSWTVLYNES
jgi:hypothetical protein